MTSSAFCPGHITALFYAPPPGDDAASTGSHGCGLCISLGVRAKVGIKRGRPTTIVPKGGTRLNPVVVMALGEYLLPMERPAAVQLELELDLPVGHGFGMSGAMTLAALMAADGELGLAGGDVDRLMMLAHRAEVEFRTGLGDVVAQVRGGIDLRVRPGLPPQGDVLSREERAEVLVAWSRRPLHTRTVLSDAAARRRLEAAAVPRLETLDGPPGLDWMLEEGWGFSQEADLAGPEVREMVGICSMHGRASQVMLGNSVFATGDLPAMTRDLRARGYEVRTTRVDNRGLRRRQR